MAHEWNDRQTMRDDLVGAGTADGSSRRDPTPVEEPGTEADTRGALRGAMEGSSTELAGGTPAPERADSGYASGAVSDAFGGAARAVTPNDSSGDAVSDTASNSDTDTDMDMDLPDRASDVTPGNS